MNSTRLLAFLLLASLALTSHLRAQGDPPVPIPDPVLASAVRSAAGLPPGAVVTQSAMLTVKYIYVDSRIEDDDGGGVFIQTVADLTGLEHALNLNSLYLGGGPYHNITSLEPIRGLTSLQMLRLPHAVKATGDALMGVTEVVGTLPNLTWLSLEGDNLENRHLPPIGVLTKLERLDLDQNKLTDLTPLKTLRRLKQLDLDNNPQCDLSPLSTMQRLRDLDLGDGYFDLLTNPFIIRQLHSLPPLRALRTLQASADDLGPLARLDQLQTFSCYGRVQDLTPLANLPRLVSFETGFLVQVDDISPLGLLPNFQPTQWSDGWWWAGVDFSRPGNAAVRNSFLQRGVLPLNPITPALWDPAHFIPDGFLRAYIANALHKPPAALQPIDLGNLAASSVQFNSLRSIEGLQHATPLQVLLSTDGWITDLSPLAGLALTNANLDLRRNYIHDVTPLIGKPFATLDLRENPINPATVPAAWWTDPRIKLDPKLVLQPQEAIPDPGLRAAVRVALSLPPDAPVSAASLQGLEYLYAEGARIESLAGLQAATNLKGLALRNNVLTSLAPLSGLSNLRWLRVSGNPPFADGAAIIAALRAQGTLVDDDSAGRFLSGITPANKVVFADAYQLSSIRYLQLFPDVEVLFLSGNYLRDISLLNNLQHLQRVHLDGNFLQTEPGTPARTTLDALVARGVTVTYQPQRPEVTTGTLVADVNFQRAIADSVGLPYVPPRFTPQQLASVTELDWEESFPDGQAKLLDPQLLLLTPNLERLSLEGAGLTDISVLASFPQLVQLDLDYNAITDLSPLAGMTQLQELDANNNEIASLAPLAGLTALLRLDLDHNRITSVSALAGLTNLIEVDLHANRIETLEPLTSLTHLQTLDVAFNELPVETTQAAFVTALMAQNPSLYYFATKPQFIPNLKLTTSNGQLVLEWQAEPSGFYYLLESEDFRTWTYFNSYVAPANGGAFQIFLGAIDRPKRFFQLQIPH
jgi:Leucine-rich repeat (LRR) protein